MTSHYKKAMEKISLSPEAIENIRTQTNTPVSSSKRRYSRPQMAGIAAVLCLAMVLLSTGVVSAYGYFFHKIPEEVAMTLKPVKLTETKQDISMTVQYASVVDGTLATYLTLEDISGQDRLAQGVNFSHSYKVSEPRSMREVWYKYDSLGYDEESHTYGFLIEITPSDASGDKLYFEDQQFIFTLEDLLLGQRREQFDYSPDWSTLPEEPDSCRRRCFSWGYVEDYQRGDYKIGYSMEMLQPGSWEIPLAEGIKITAAGFLKDGFHIQIRYDDQLTRYDYGNLTLITSDGNEIGGIGCEEGNYCFASYKDEDNYKYTDYIYDIAPEDLEGAALRGDFVCGGTLLEGDWEVIFTIDQEQSGDENPLS